MESSLAYYHENKLRRTLEGHRRSLNLQWTAKIIISFKQPLFDNKTSPHLTTSLFPTGYPFYVLLPLGHKCIFNTAVLFRGDEYVLKSDLIVQESVIKSNSLISLWFKLQMLQMHFIPELLSTGFLLMVTVSYSWKSCSPKHRVTFIYPWIDEVLGIFSEHRTLARDSNFWLMCITSSRC